MLKIIFSKTLVLATQIIKAESIRLGTIFQHRKENQMNTQNICYCSNGTPVPYCKRSCRTCKGRFCIRWTPLVTGWTYRHDIGRQQVEEAYGDKVETLYIQSVQYGPEAERVIRDMASSGVDIIFATSFGYMEPMLKVAKEFPDVKFEHATGYKRT